MTLILILVSILLMPFAATGLALIHQGLGRSRSAAHTMLGTLCVLAVSAIAFIAIGGSPAGASSSPAHVFHAAGARWDWLGAGPSLLRAALPGAVPQATAALCFQMFAAGLAGVIPVSSGSDRWRLAPMLLSSGVFAAFLFPLLAHWLWNGGWLMELGVTFGLARPLDCGGAAVIQVFGGLMALSVTLILGPRRGKYREDGMAAAIPGHNIVQVLFGCLLAFVGWIGLESASSLLFYALTPEALPALIINAMLSASSGCLAAVVTTKLRYRKPDASLGANGWIAGLVAGSAACAFAPTAAAILTGAVAGVLAALLIEVFELRLLVDDPGGSISVHAAAGLWGLIAAGLFSHVSANVSGVTHGRQVLAQLVVVATCVGLMLPLIHVVHLVLNRLMPYRVDADGDWQGMDIRELGSGAYPEFVVHADEFLPR